MESLTPDELYVLSCALDRQRERMFTCHEDYSDAEHYAIGQLIGRLTAELDRRDAE